MCPWNQEMVHWMIRENNFLFLFCMSSTKKSKLSVKKNVLVQNGLGCCLDVSLRPGLQGRNKDFIQGEAKLWQP